MNSHGKLEDFSAAVQFGFWTESESDVRVNAATSGPVWVPLIPATLGLTGTILFGRPAQPVEQGVICVCLASDDASDVAGEIQGATGGQSPV